MGAVGQKNFWNFSQRERRLHRTLAAVCCLHRFSGNATEDTLSTRLDTPALNAASSPHALLLLSLWLLLSLMCKLHTCQPEAASHSALVTVLDGGQLSESAITVRKLFTHLHRASFQCQRQHAKVLFFAVQPLHRRPPEGETMYHMGLGAPPSPA